MSELKRKLEDETTCYEHCRDMSDQFMQLGNFEKAAAYSENATRSLKELARLEEFYKKEVLLNRDVINNAEVMQRIVDMYG